jgi:hypothetical protein
VRHFFLYKKKGNHEGRERGNKKKGNLGVTHLQGITIGWAGPNVPDWAGKCSWRGGERNESSSSFPFHPFAIAVAPNNAKESMDNRQKG